MLSQTDTPIDSAIRFFSNFGRFASYFVPTDTGLEKSIIDATDQLRKFFKTEGIHDYGKQAKGTEEKILYPIKIVTPRGIIETQMSFYRPRTKNGDPRFWIYNSRSASWSLPNFVRSGNLLAFFVVDGKLYLLNMSDSHLLKDATRDGSMLASLLRSETDFLDPIARELLEKMQILRNKGFIKSLKSGDTGIGFTLESLLGIKANSNKNPDYKGIELKSSRSKKSRSNLFAKTPDWNLSPYRALDIVNRFGYLDREGRRAYRNTLQVKPNSQGLFLFVPVDQQSVEGRALLNNVDALLTIWPISTLEDSLRLKHRRTFWVEAKSQKDVDGSEEFQFDAITYTKDPLIANFAPLVSTGHITCDFLMRQKPSGKIKDHGYLFKMKPRDLDLLFPIGRRYSLAS